MVLRTPSGACQKRRRLVPEENFWGQVDFYRLCALPVVKALKEALIPGNIEFYCYISLKFRSIVQVIPLRMCHILVQVWTNITYYVDSPGWHQEKHLATKNLHQSVSPLSRHQPSTVTVSRFTCQLVLSINTGTSIYGRFST